LFFSELFGSLLVEIALLDLLLEGLYLFVLADQLLELNSTTDFLIFSLLEFFSELVLGDVEIDAVVGVLLLLVEGRRCHL